MSASGEGAELGRTIWQELDAWARALAPWQKYILAAAIRDGELANEQIDAAFTLFLADLGLAQLPEDAPKVPISITGRPEEAAPAPLTLTRLSDLQNVNALPTTAELTFGEQLTVIYGGTGTGKSGFARVLSNACFSRARPKILPNIYAETSSEVSATITIKGGSQTEQPVAFTPETENPELRRIAVFDTSVARVHLTDQNPLGFTPMGFDVFTEMTRVYGEIGNRLSAAIQARARENTFTKSFLEPASPISEQIAALGSDTDIDALKAIAVFEEQETARLAEIGRQTTELRAMSAEQTLKGLGEAKADIATLMDRVGAALAALQPTAKKTYRQRLADFTSKTRQAVDVGAGSFKSTYFKATGSEIWERFIATARDLALVEHADYPQPGDHCLLCHRALDEPSITLIRRFWNFLDSAARLAAVEANAILDRTVADLRSLRLDIFEPDSRVYGHLSRLDPALAQRVVDLISGLRSDRDQTVHVLEEGSGEILSPDHNDVTGTIDVLLKKIETQAEQLRTTDRDVILKSLEAEHVTLRHRQVLRQLIGDIETFVADEKWAKKAQAAQSALNTRAITTKENELFKEVIEKTYRTRFQGECAALDCALPLDLQTHGRGGQTKRWLAMQGGHKPIDILSEGEQRAVALSDFLTEVNLNPVSAGIILDDPVTSQDHQRKERIVHRLVAEAKTRQTIIFTHDLVFLTHLIEAAEEQGVDIVTHWVERDEERRPGQVVLNDSPANTADYQTTRKAKATLEEAKKLAGQARVQAVQRGMAELRRTTEEIILRHLFKNVVRRWNERVMVGSLKKINWSTELADEIDAVFSDLSRYIEGHSHSVEYSAGPPEPRHLDEMIQRVDDLIGRAKPERTAA